MDLSTGLFVLTKTDLALADVLPIALTRTYRQNDAGERAFGIGTNHPYSVALYSENSFITISLILPDGGRIRYQRTSAGTSYSNAVLEHTETPTRFYKSVLQYTGSYPGTWTITLLDGTVYAFTFNGDVKSVTDRFGNAITLTREMIIVPSFLFPMPWGKIQRITGPSGRWIDLTYDGTDRIVAESFFATVKVELVHDAAWATRAAARVELVEYLEVFYNGQRRHSALGYLSPRAFERQREHEAWQLNQGVYQTGSKSNCPAAVVRSRLVGQDKRYQRYSQPGPGGGGIRDVTDPDEDGTKLVRDERTGRPVSPWQDLAPLRKRRQYSRDVVGHGAASVEV